ncbi:MAG: ribokinase [Proteocatella sp.]
MKILNFGSLNIDRVYSVDEFVKPGETISSTNMGIFAGGKGLNQSVAVAKAGAEIYHAGMIGKEGEFLKELLQESNVNTSLLKTVEGESGHAVIQVNKNGQNCILLYSGANHKIDEEYVNYVLQNFEEGDILILQNEISCLDYIIKKAYDKNMKIALNPSPINANIDKIELEKIQWLILNEIEGEALTGENDPERIISCLLNRFSNLKIILTLGEKGSIYGDLKETAEQPVYKIKAIDTTAAGDTFTGYFISGISKSNDVKEILRTSSIAAAISVSRKGAANSIPGIAEVNAKLDIMEENI